MSEDLLLTLVTDIYETHAGPIDTHESMEEAMVQQMEAEWLSMEDSSELFENDFVEEEGEWNGEVEVETIALNTIVKENNETIWYALFPIPFQIGFIITTINEDLEQRTDYIYLSENKVWTKRVVDNIQSDGSDGNEESLEPEEQEELYNTILKINGDNNWFNQ